MLHAPEIVTPSQNGAEYPARFDAAGDTGRKRTPVFSTFRTGDEIFTINCGHVHSKNFQVQQKSGHFWALFRSLLPSTTEIWKSEINSVYSSPPYDFPESLVKRSPASDISVRKIILVTVSIQFGYNNFSYSSVTVIKKSIISVSIQLQLIN